MSDKPTPSQPSLATFLQGQAPATAPLPAEPVAPVASDQEAAQALHEGGDITVADDLIPSQQANSDTLDEEPAPPATAVAAPSFMRTERQAGAPPRATPRWQWGVVAALGLLLLVQVLVADRARLAADAGTRPLVSALCTVLRCTLPAWHEPSAYSMLSREIRPVPGQPGVLQVQASFRNEARWEQAWPALRLSLSDADGRVIGRRTLQPAEYLGPAADAQGRLAPGQSAQVSFRLREPAAATVAFSFEFQ